VIVLIAGLILPVEKSTAVRRSDKPENIPWSGRSQPRYFVPVDLFEMNCQTTALYGNPTELPAIGRNPVVEFRFLIDNQMS
jgi:hypothetical protein